MGTVYRERRCPQVALVKYMGLKFVKGKAT
jgi:hypothetical protein